MIKKIISFLDMHDNVFENEDAMYKKMANLLMAIVKGCLIVALLPITILGYLAGFRICCYCNDIIKPWNKIYIKYNSRGSHTFDLVEDYYCSKLCKNMGAIK